jgi:hypothetical protein
VQDLAEPDARCSSCDELSLRFSEAAASMQRRGYTLILAG